MTKSTAERKAAQRQRDKDAGLIEVTVKIPAVRKPELLEFAKTLNKKYGDKV